MDLIDLKKRLDKINFSRKLILTVDGTNKKFNSTNEAIKWLKENKNIPENISEAMIKSSNYNIDNWDLNADIKDNEHAIKSTSLIDRFMSMHHLSKQVDIYDHEFVCFDPLSIETIDDNIYDGICCLTSIYNAYPKLFDYNKGKLIKIIKQIGQNKYDNFLDCIDYINDYMKSYLPFDMFITSASDNGYSLTNEIENALDKNIPVCFSGLLYNESDDRYFGHAVTILGYNEMDYYIYDNAIDNLNSVFIDNCLHGFITKYSKTTPNNLHFKKYGFNDLANMFIEEKSFGEIYKYLQPKVQINLKKNQKIIKVNKQFIFDSYKWSIIAYMNPKLKQDQYKSKLWLI